VRLAVSTICAVEVSSTTIVVCFNRMRILSYHASPSSPQAAAIGSPPANYSCYFTISEMVPAPPCGAFAIANADPFPEPPADQLHLKLHIVTRHHHLHALGNCATPRHIGCPE